MKKGLIAVGVIVVLMLAFGLWYGGTYNSVVALDTEVSAKSAQIDNLLLRRSDLVPDLVKVANKYAAYEQETITAISNARAAMLGAGTTAEKMEANNELSSAISRLLAISENYPDLKANQQYITLMDEMAGTENRIAVARKDYNESVQQYNVKIKTFPTVLIANMMGASEKAFFEVDETSKVKPEYDL
ncbi:MAG: LemA family protein [Clostridia bacterium]|nr:LemA family protein [Clostridia bacterium]